MQNLIIGSGRRRTSLIKLFSFPFPRFPSFHLRSLSSWLGKELGSAVCSGFMEFHLFFPPKSCLSVIMPCSLPVNSLPLLEYFPQKCLIFYKTWNEGWAFPTVVTSFQTKIIQESFFFFFFPLGMLFMLFLTAPEVWTPGNTQIIGVSLRTKCLQNIKRRDLSTPHRREFFGGFGFLLGISRNIHSMMAPWSCLNSIPKFRFFKSRWCSLKKSPEVWKWSSFIQKSPLAFPLHLPSGNLGILLKQGNRFDVWWRTKVGFSSNNGHKHS